MSYETLARRSQKAFEVFVGMMFLSREVRDLSKALGLRGRQGYFLQRSAPLGAVPGQVVAATFYNFNPTQVIPLVDSGWQVTTPEIIWREYTQACEAALTRLLVPVEAEPDLMGNVEKALPLVRKATSQLSPAGRPLFAACQALPWPEDSSIKILWHGLNLLREYRGDGHVAVLLAEGLDPVECLLVSAAYSQRIPLPLLIKLRMWDEEAVKAAQQRLDEEDILRDGVLTDKGREMREHIELLTDQRDTAPFETLGEAGADELIGLVEPLNLRVVKHGGVTWD